MKVSVRDARLMLQLQEAEMAQADLREAKEIAAKHGWTAQEGGGYPDGGDRTGVKFTRNDETMTTEWFTGTDVAQAFVWADYVGGTEPEGVYTQHLAVMMEFITTAPTNSAQQSECVERWETR